MRDFYSERGGTRNSKLNQWLKRPLLNEEHSKPSTTLNNYAHTVPGMQEKAAAIMDGITTPVALPANLTAPQLHQESDA